jgi:ATP/maltotriose-dependent transcriptional regulator MalT
MPGQALLQLDRGDAAGAADAMRRALEETDVPAGRPVLLAGAVDVFCAAGDLADARAAADALEEISRSSPSRALAAMADQAHGACLLGEQDPVGALSPLRSAGAAWRALRMPYEGARTAHLLGSALLALGDDDGARIEFDDARTVFARLGATTDLDRLAVTMRATAPSPGGAVSTLSLREREVLAAVAAGKTNRQIADDLTISPHTVSRHLENIFTKLGVSSRAAATACAYRDGLLG